MTSVVKLNLLLILILFLTGCFGGSSTEADGFKITKKIAVKDPLTLFHEAYIPMVLDEKDCSQDPGIWFSNSGLGYEDFKESLPAAKEILKALELVEPKVISGNFLEEKFNKLLNEKSDRNKTEAERCSQIAKDILSIKLVTSVKFKLDQHLQQLYGASVEARKNLELGSRFAVAIDQSLINEAASACEEVKKLKLNLEDELKDKVKSCFSFAYGQDNWTEQAGARFGCDHFGSKLCKVAERIFK
jgi:hypothetical protein